jgi:signal transduction histidine kinase
MQEVYLRNHTAAIAARLETLASREEARALAEEEPGVLELRVLEQAETPGLRDLWSGKELFRAEMVHDGGYEIFRAYVPFHEKGMLRVARIDLDAASADFLLAHARHNVVTSAVSGLFMVLLAGYALLAMRRLAAEEKHRLELGHLAHLGKMAAVLAHEIRNPLGTIKGFTQLALENASDNIRPMLVPLLSETQRLERLVTDLLLYGRPPQPVKSVCTWQEVTASLRGLPETVHIDGTSLRFRSDAEMLRHVLANLIRNATEAVGADAGGSVRVSAAAAGKTVVLAVEDNGPGIPEGYRDKVFESFFTTKSFGTGLGLSICRSLTEALGGTLELKRGAEGGVRAEVRLPGALIEERLAEVMG